MVIPPNVLAQWHPPAELTPESQHPLLVPPNPFSQRKQKKHDKLVQINEALKKMEDAVYGLRVRKAFYRYRRTIGLGKRAAFLRQRAAMKKDSAAMKALAMSKAAAAAKAKKKGVVAKKKSVRR